MPASAPSNTINLSEMPQVITDRVHVQNIIRKNSVSLELLQSPNFKDKVYDQNSLDQFVAQNENVIQP